MIIKQSVLFRHWRPVGNGFSQDPLFRLARSKSVIIHQNWTLGVRTDRGSFQSGSSFTVVEHQSQRLNAFLFVLQFKRTTLRQERTLKEKSKQADVSFDTSVFRQRKEIVAILASYFSLRCSICGSFHAALFLLVSSFCACRRERERKKEQAGQCLHWLVLIIVKT